MTLRTRKAMQAERMKFAYADPPYIGMAKKHYGDHPDYAGEVDHRALVDRLVSEFPDGWALSLSSPTLQIILPMCPDDVRVMSWVKPFASFKPGVNPANAWEPVIVRGGRKSGRDVETVRDWVSAPITLQRGTHGAKPLQFCFWIFAVLGARRGDELDDLFPGSGAVTKAWEQWIAQAKIPFEVTA